MNEWLVSHQVLVAAVAMLLMFGFFAAAIRYNIVEDRKKSEVRVAKPSPGPKPDPPSAAVTYSSKPTRPSVRCRPERIRPSTCTNGVVGCHIKTVHSHVEDLARRLKEKR